MRHKTFAIHSMPHDPSIPIKESDHSSKTSKMQPEHTPEEDTIPALESDLSCRPSDQSFKDHASPHRVTQIISSTFVSPEKLRKQLNQRFGDECKIYVSKGSSEYSARAYGQPLSQIGAKLLPDHRTRQAFSCTAQAP